jgi:PhzF family phenazine biosynthesis protein
MFGGNPACVVPLKEWLPDEMLFRITKENAVAETAFFIDKGDRIHLRWFTPEIEMDLCGLVYDSEEQVKKIKIDRNMFDQINLDTGGVIVTAKGEQGKCRSLPMWAGGVWPASSGSIPSE